MGPPPGPVTRKGPHVTQTPPRQAWVACLGLAPLGQTLAHSRPKTAIWGKLSLQAWGALAGIWEAGARRAWGSGHPCPPGARGLGRPRGGGLSPLPQPPPPPRGPS